MKKRFLFFFLFIYALTISAQGGFRFKKEGNKVSIPFKLINNLVFIPINVNGVELTFLLDSGVKETILFSLEDKNEVSLKNIEKITLRGLGSEDAIEGLKSVGNVLEVKGMESINHLLYIIVDQDFNLSSHIGIPVNGIIGSSIFKNNLIEINYEKKRVVFYKDSRKNRKRIESKYKKTPITVEGSKPYVKANAIIDSDIIPVKLLVDVGNSDAIWLFQNISDKIKVPKNNFDDYLGKGFSGDVEGKRARITEFSIVDFKFLKPIIAFPDYSSIKHVTMVSDRVGSVGGEILKRFSVIFDYQNEFLYLKKNRHYFASFVYNKSGIEIRHSGVQWVKETVQLQAFPITVDHLDTNGGKNATSLKYKFQLKPIFEIANIRKNSPAENSGLQKGDVIISINKNPAYKYSLQQINSLLRSEEEKWITIEIERNKQALKFSFQLIDVL
ncbi:PDZ domain-containing protein [Flavobacterium frigoris]|uniref:PDZ domain-containing protein n=1 Tax=Flavobacterium frigoris TaxID=229204 RepID=A0A1H9JAV5_FLAFI|nr:PDZ domain-containing protein [Flavobacterium frigoris]SEQ84161.1 PDZ domain-containing protein [Flavobacterium frigoris]